MSFQLKPPVTPRPRPGAPVRVEDRGAFAVGSRVLITAGNAGQRGVDLFDENGTPLGIRLAIDLPVTITAWRPRRGAAARYRVGSADGVEGWVEAADLRRIPPPPPPPAPVAVAPPKLAPKPAAKAASKPVPKPATKPAPRAALKVAPTRPAAKAVAAVAPKPVAAKAAAVRSPKVGRSRTRKTRSR